MASRANISFRWFRTSSNIEGGIRWYGSLNGLASCMGIGCLVLKVRPRSSSWCEKAISHLSMRSLATSICNPVRRTDISSQSNWSIRGTAESASSNSSGETTEHCCKLHNMVLAGILTACFPWLFTSSEIREVPGAKLNTHGVRTTLPPNGLSGALAVTVILPQNTGAWTIPLMNRPDPAGTV